MCVCVCVCVCVYTPVSGWLIISGLRVRLSHGRSLVRLLVGSNQRPS